MKNVIASNLYPKYLILCSKILLNVLHNMGLTVFFTMVTYWVPDLSNFKDFSGYLSCSILIFANSASYAYKRVSASLWLRLTFLELKISNISNGWGLEKNELPRNYQPTNFNGLRCKLAKKGLFIYFI